MKARLILGCAVAVAAVGKVDPLTAQQQVPRPWGDTVGVAAPCDSTADDIEGWPEAYGGTLPATFRMRVPPELTELINQTTRGATRVEYRAGARSLAWLLATGRGGGVTSMRQLAVARRCYRRVSGGIVQYWATRVGTEYMAGALWGWGSSDSGATLLMHAVGPDSAWQRRALAALRTVGFDTAQPRRPKPPIP
jgi:hypothetical protein